MDQDLLSRNEYRVAENRIVRKPITGRVWLSDGERTTLAELSQRLGKKALAEVVAVVNPETLRAWHRKRIARTCDGSTQRHYPGRPRIDPATEQVIVQFAIENRPGGDDRMVGALKNVGDTVRDQTVGNILKSHNLPPAPERKKTTSWRECIRSHRDILVATDFFTTEVWTKCGLVTYDILFFIQVGSRKVHMAGLTPSPTGALKTQMARHSTLAAWGFLTPGQHVIDDRDTKFCSAFQETVNAVGVIPITLPPRSPNVNAHPERWVRTVKEKVLSRLILFGEGALRQVLKEYDIPYHQDRNHQGKGHE